MRSRWILAAATLALLSACSLLSLPSVLLNLRVRKDVTYTPKNWPAPLVADLYTPSSKVPTPAVLLIHGGGWKEKERRSDMTSIAKALASHGYFVMNVTYRLTPNWQYPAPIDDLAEAVRYLRHHAKQLNIDPQRIATFGYSAGGHLAALIGLDPRNQIDAIVAGGAPTNMAFWPNGEMSSLFLGGPLRGNEAVYRAASPVSHVTRNSPPVFIYHGTGDQLVPIEHPQALIAQLKKYNVPHEVYWLEGKSHVKTHLFPADSISKAITFLDQHVR